MAMPRGGRPLVTVNWIPASRKRETASAARCVSTFSCVTRVPSTSAITIRIGLALGPFFDAMFKPRSIVFRSRLDCLSLLVPGEREIGGSGQIVARWEEAAVGCVRYLRFHDSFSVRLTRDPLYASQVRRKQEPEMSVCKVLADSRGYIAAAAVALLLVSNAQQVSAQQQGSSEGASPQREAAPDLQPQTGSDKSLPESGQVDDAPKHSKRILGIFPNYRAVYTNTKLPPLSVRDKFWLATQDSFDYSSFISAGIISGVSQAN